MGVGGIYQSVNAIPNVMFEIAAGGILAAVAVPLIAHQLGAGQRDRADHTASVLLSWALLVLVPLAALLWLFARADLVVAGWSPATRGRRGRHHVAADLRRAGAALRAGHHPHRAAAGPPPVPRRRAGAAGVVDRRARVLPLVRLDRRRAGRAVARQRRGRPGARLGHHARGRRAVGAARRAGDAHRVALAPGAADAADDARRIGSLAGAGVIALLAQQAAVVATMWLRSSPGDKGTFTVYTYAQAVYLLPYAVLAVPVATSAFPALAARTGAGEDVTGTLARSLRAVLVLTALSVGVLIAAAPAIGAFFSLLDARRGDGATSTAALAALPATITAYAPGLVGFGLTALLTRALYVRGRPTDAGLAAALGWSLAALLPLVVLAGGQSPATTLRWLGVSSTLGMTLAGMRWCCSCVASGVPR